MPKIIAKAKATNKGDTYTTALQSGTHHLIADELPEVKGNDEGPAPGDYLCMALASCTAITLRMYVQRKGWQVDEIVVSVNLVKGTETTSGLNTFYCELQPCGDLTEEQQKRLLEIAKACPIHRLLTKPSEVVTIVGGAKQEKEQGEA